MGKARGIRIDDRILDTVITGRVDPHIYAFTTQTVPNYLKVGDTYRPIRERLDEWRVAFPDLKYLYSHSARIDDDTIFRDYSVHKFLEADKSRHRLQKEDMPELQYYSNEFFKDANAGDIDEAIADIHKCAREGGGKYSFYSSEHLPKILEYKRDQNYSPRENQEQAIENFAKALKLGRKNLLMFAVMRFGKTFTAMCCAQRMKAKKVLVLSAKVDVNDEWRKTVQSHVRFDGYIFADKRNLLESESFLRDSLAKKKKVVLFLSLQDLQGEDMKEVHREVFGLDWDLAIVDETHFGARAEHYGKVLQNKKSASAELKRQLEDVDVLDSLDNAIKELHARVTLHLSVTPYRILMGDEFEKEDIIAFFQFSDIADAQRKWIEQHKFDEKTPEWKNPYFGFPKMIRFAFNPNQSSLERIARLKAEGATASFSELFRPKSLTPANDGYCRFAHQDVVLDFLKVIDGVKEDANVLGFLDNERIKSGKLCRHMVFALPYCASCDAMEALIKQNAEEFKNLSEYEIINISGVKRDKRFNNTPSIKRHIEDCEAKGIKTITLTVNRMLTGNTVPQWDTMLYLKATSSPEEYDQAIFRLQNPYIDAYVDKDGTYAKIDMKPQTILVDFDPERVFRLQEFKSQIYNVNTDNNGNSRLRARIEKELEISPIIVLDHNKLREVTANNVMDAVRRYSETRSVIDEAADLPIDMSLLKNADLLRAVLALNALKSKKGIMAPANSKPDDDGDDVNPTAQGESSGANAGLPAEGAQPQRNDDDTLAKKFASYFALILFFAFLTDDNVTSLEEIIGVLDASDDNKRICLHLELSPDMLKYIQSHCNGFILSKLDDRIKKTNELNQNDGRNPLERARLALTKFGRMSESEIVTPAKVADDMVGLLPEDVFEHGPALDIASKQGEFAIALLKRYGNSAADKIYSVCTSKLAYEFTRKIYKLLSLPIDHIFDSFTSYDLIKRNKDKKFIVPQAIQDMNFSTIIGNPPYQENLEAGRSLAKQLFPAFIEFGIDQTPCWFSLITPARWFTADAQDNSFPRLREYIRKHNNFSTIITDNGKCLFPDTELSMVNYFLWTNGYRGKVKFVENHNARNDFFDRPLFEKGLDIIIPQNKIISILKKIKTKKFVSLNTITTGRDAFGIVGKDFVKRSQSKTFEDAIAVQCAYEQIRYIKREEVKKGTDILDKYKVFTSKGNGGAGLLTDGKPVTIIGKSYIGEPGMACTDSLIPFGRFTTIIEAQNLQKYMSTKFLRFCVGILKVSQNLYQNVYSFVPLQDFTAGSDIDWTVSVEDIDRQLYGKYGLDEKEIAFIEAKIKPMP
ncbi:MAG: Eco57I restriction-modification methylase domain-containing protein [Clostridium sp.]|nr:Eco57I restriction-modification methylase domain-containing protein [Clostridium sp.]